MFINRGGTNEMEDLLLNDINPEYMTELEKETIYNEGLFEIFK